MVFSALVMLVSVVGDDKIMCVFVCVLTARMCGCPAVRGGCVNALLTHPCDDNGSVLMQSPISCLLVHVCVCVCVWCHRERMRVSGRGLEVIVSWPPRWR